MASSHNKPVVVLKVGTSSLLDPQTRKAKVSFMARIAEVTWRLSTDGERD